MIDIEANNRCEYPAERVVHDIIELCNDLDAIGCAVKYQHTMNIFDETGTLVDEKLFDVTVWAEKDKARTYHTQPEIEVGEQQRPLMSGTDYGDKNGWAIYKSTDFDSLTRLHDRVANLLAAQRIEKNMMSKADVMALALAGGMNKGNGNIRAALFVLCLLALLATVGHFDFQDELQQQQVYCDNVAAGAWPDFNHNAKEVCK